MDYKSLNLVYFSPTGTTRRIVHAIASMADLPLREYDRTSVLSRTQGAHFGASDLVLLALPVYGGRLPRIAAEFFAQLTADGAPTALLVSYGNRHYDDALRELKNMAAEKGFCAIAAGAFVGEHSFTRKVATHRPDAPDALTQADFGRRFLEKARHLPMLTSALRRQNEVKVPGSFPYEKPLFNLQITPATNSDCVNCQTCVEGCPTGAISWENPANVDREKCISCCFCIKICPKGARQMEDPRILAAITRLETHFTARREAELFI